LTTIKIVVVVYPDEFDANTLKLVKGRITFGVPEMTPVVAFSDKPTGKIWAVEVGVVFRA
jgi:hypothetical protein